MAKKAEFDGDAHRCRDHCWCWLESREEILDDYSRLIGAQSADDGHSLKRYVLEQMDKQLRETRVLLEQWEGCFGKEK